MAKLAVMLCVKNGSEFLRDQLDSIENQTWKNFDIYIKDNFSNDGSSKVIHDFKNKNPYSNVINCKGMMITLLIVI